MTTKIGALAGALGNLVKFVLVPGQHHGVNLVEKLMDGIVCGAFPGDEAFGANKVGEFQAKNKIEAVIPARKGTTGGAGYDKEKYKWRHLIENFFCRIKAFRRIATRYEKTGACFSAMINLVNIAIVPM